MTYEGEEDRTTGNAAFDGRVYTNLALVFELN